MLKKFPYCLVVRIPGSHPGGPGSIPGMGVRAFKQLSKQSMFSKLATEREYIKHTNVLETTSP